MTEALARHRDPIVSAIRVAIGRAEHLDRVGRWGGDFRRRLEEFACRGKLIRGALVAVGSSVFGRQADSDVYALGAAIELIQSFLLIHDDIMDEDEVRRGEPTLFAQYRDAGVSGGYGSPQRFGESMAICAGDVTVLLAFECIAATSLDDGVKLRLIELIAGEIGDVGIAQMADVANGHSTDEISDEEIRAVYRYKTGRYTFSLPLSLGAVLAGASEADIDLLCRWGELQGLIFQVRDDELGLMQDDPGKPIGSDIESDKKTLHRRLLLDRSSGTQWSTIVDHFGSPVSERSISEVRRALNELGVLDSIDAELKDLASEATRVLTGLTGAAPDARKMLAGIAAYNISRTR